MLSVVDTYAQECLALEVDTGFATRAAALRAIDGLRLDINAVTVSNSSITIRELIEHYTLIELTDEASKTQRTKRVYKQHLDAHVIPKWGRP